MRAVYRSPNRSLKPGQTAALRRVAPAVAVLDEYLLTGRVPRQAIWLCLARIASSQYRRYLEIANLIRVNPQDASDLTPALLRLRVLFTSCGGEPLELLSMLHSVCELYQLLEAFVRGEIDGLHLREEYNLLGVRHRESPGRDPRLGCLLGDMSLAVALYCPESSEEPYTTDLDLLSEAFKTQNRLAGLWSSVLGDPGSASL
ncbi:MAG TPA: hypothetical protein VGS41_07820 [Chthonomonadales bacterium]|nr:hypothetical protein [Chthonomonadales bacterium]